MQVNIIKKPALYRNLSRLFDGEITCLFDWPLTFVTKRTHFNTHLFNVSVESVY